MTMSKHENAHPARDGFVGRIWNRIVEARTLQAERQIRHYNRLWK
jgi:hypothetical protein